MILITTSRRTKYLQLLHNATSIHQSAELMSLVVSYCMCETRGIINQHLLFEETTRTLRKRVAQSKEMCTNISWITL